MCHATQDPGEEGEAPDASKAAKGVRTITGRCWMAANFPMSLRQLLPILDIVGTANKHLARAGKFLQKYGNMDLFPVKMQARTIVSSRKAMQSMNLTR